MQVKFGRYTDAFKPKEKVERWREAEKYFAEKNYPALYKSFFEYINNDEENSVAVTENNGAVSFQVQQGSSVVKGTADAEKVTAEAEIARFEKASVAFMRRLLEMNFSLFYTKFSISDEKICMNFYSNAVDASPRKLYYALKEIALRSDKQDEVLLEDFSMLKPVPEEHKEPLPESEKEIKYKYLIQWINEALAKIDTLNQEKFAGGISFLLLELLYKIDYLILPQGLLMNSLEKMNLAYYSKDNRSYPERNQQMYREFKELIAKPKEEILKELYNVKATFALVEPTGHQAIADTIKNEIEKTIWYRDNDHRDIALKILAFIPVKCFFSYGMPAATRELFHLLLNILNGDYFTELGITDIYYDTAAQTFNQILVSEKINAVVEKSKTEYPNLAFSTANLKYDSLYSFTVSFLREIEKLDYNT